MNLQTIRHKLRSIADPKRVNVSAWFFKTGKFVGWLILSILLWYLINFIAKWFVQTAYSDTSVMNITLLWVKLLLFFFLLIVCFDVVRKFTVRYSTITNIILVIFTLIISFSAFYIERFNFVVERYDSKNKINQVLIQTTLLNRQYADELVQDKKHEWVYWRYFSTDPYKQSLDHMMSNYPIQCTNSFIELLGQAEIINEQLRVMIENRGYGKVVDSTLALEAEDRFRNKLQDDIVSRAIDFKIIFENLSYNCNLPGTQYCYENKMGYRTVGGANNLF